MRPPHPLPRRRVLVAAGAWALTGTMAMPARATLARGEPMRWPTVTLLDGTVVPPSHWAGQAAVVVFWSVTCPFCRRHNPHVNQLHRAAAGRALKVLTVSIDRDPAAVRRYVAEQGYRFPVTMDNHLLAPLLAARRVIPLTCTIDRQGRFVQAIPGEMFEEDVLELLPQLTA